MCPPQRFHSLCQLVWLKANIFFLKNNCSLFFFIVLLTIFLMQLQMILHIFAIINVCGHFIIEQYGAMWKVVTEKRYFSVQFYFTVFYIGVLKSFLIITVIEKAGISFDSVPRQLVNLLITLHNTFFYSVHQHSKCLLITFFMTYSYHFIQLTDLKGLSFLSHPGEGKWGKKIQRNDKRCVADLLNLLYVSYKRKKNNT